MPRGSDAEAAGEELKARTGFTPNAEDMIAENTARFTEELRAASNRPIDQEATDEMGEDGAQAYAEKGETVVSHAVRGPFVVIVTEDDETGEVRKSAHPVKGQEKKAERLANRGQAKKDDDDEDDDDGEEKPAARSRTGASSGAAASK